MPDALKNNTRQRRGRFSLCSCGESGEGVEILAITAGSGNGWVFSAEALSTSLPLWDGVECFIDHDWKSRSLRDLAGVCYRPRWSEPEQGIRLDIRPVGPAAGVLRQAAGWGVQGGSELYWESTPVWSIPSGRLMARSAKQRLVEHRQSVRPGAWCAG